MSAEEYSGYDTGDKMLTIASTFSPFKGERGRIQRNALRSWLRLSSEVFIISDSREEGVMEFAADVGVRILSVPYTDYGMPYWHSLIHVVQKEAKNDVICVTDGDDIHFQCLIEAVKVLKESGFKDYLATGRRWDVDVTEEIDWYRVDADRLKQEYIERGFLHAPGGCDYFIFPRGFDWSHMPNFVVARGELDTWMNADVLERGIPLIDLTDDVMVAHQNHDYTYKKDDVYREQRESNRLLAGYYTLHEMHAGSDKATYVLSGGKISRR